MDEVNLDEFLKEAASAIDNPDILAEYIREKATIAIERFLVRHFLCLICFFSNVKAEHLTHIELSCRTIYPKCLFRWKNASLATDGSFHVTVVMEGVLH